ncbi:MAG: hypothetical protein RI953_676 [Pseudomonadota bacterium]|jgi:hypothetical protein
MSDHKKPESSENGRPFEAEASAKILPFRKPEAVQSTLPRRKGGLSGKREGSQRPGSDSSPWKSKLAQALQIGLLVVGLLMALRNCGKL